MHFNALPAVSSGQSVTARQYLGGMGTTGNSTGVHLHLGMATDYGQASLTLRLN